MTLKEFLNQAFEIEKSIKAKEKQIQRLRDAQANTGSKLSIDKVQTSPDHDKQGKLSDLVMDLENSFHDDIVRLMDMKRKIKKVISAEPNVTYQLILEERYINTKEWRDIATDNGYSESRLYELHGEALQDLIGKILWHYFDSI